MTLTAATAHGEAIEINVDMVIDALGVYMLTGVRERTMAVGQIYEVVDERRKFEDWLTRVKLAVIRKQEEELNGATDSDVRDGDTGGD